MTSAFHSWSDFWQMGGYAFYVWLAVVVWHACWQRRALLADVQRQMARERRMQAARKKGEAL